ncbi:MAG: class I SAM-dependent methyltransferase [Sulfurospirillum sp.]|nr:class I SAM-dependent methyltransferase [Sulfurospirillum sp.]
MIKTKVFLEENLYQEGLKYFGVKNKLIANQLATRWHNDLDSVDTYRWYEIIKYKNHEKKILDMACGCGTFLFYGLHQGYDVYGIEPEKWKLNYMNMKIDELNYPQKWKNKIIEAVGENLPFENESFDYVESAQTLEHVKDFNKCIDEMIRVTKVSGKIRILHQTIMAFMRHTTGYHFYQK